jgi:hypothetical protein
MGVVQSLDELVGILERAPDPTEEPELQMHARAALALLTLAAGLPVATLTAAEQRDHEQVLAALPALRVRVAALGIPVVEA